MTKLTYQDVFVPGGFPKHTYNARTSLNLEPRLEETAHNLCKLVTVTGQTKSGKTVLAKKIFAKDASIWVDGGAIGSEDDFWQVVIDQLDGHQSYTTSTQESVSKELGGEGQAGINILVKKVNAKLSIKSVRGNADSTSRTRTLSSRVSALRLLEKVRLPLIIDDFHYLDKSLQGSLIRALKPLVFEGIPVVIIAIPHRRYDALKVEKEMTGRISPVEVENWSKEELLYIPQKGFELLKIRLSSQIEEVLSDQALESPHLMQEFCRGISKQLYADGNDPTTPKAKLDTNRMFREVAETIGKPIFEKLARGPRSRTDRVQRELKSGETVDIYVLVLHALAQLKPALISLEYEDLRTAIKDVSSARMPQMQEVVRVLKQMSSIASSDTASTPVIDFEEEDQKLHITDPFFAFYLRWGSLSSK